MVRDYIINNYGATTSINNIVKELNKNGTSIRFETVSKYIQHLIDAKIILGNKTTILKTPIFKKKENIESY
jgi:predicted AAA+ superfamily ATPase